MCDIIRTWAVKEIDVTDDLIFALPRRPSEQVPSEKKSRLYDSGASIPRRMLIELNTAAGDARQVDTEKPVSVSRRRRKQKQQQKNETLVVFASFTFNALSFFFINFFHVPNARRAPFSKGCNQHN